MKGQETSLLTPSLLSRSAPWVYPSFKSTPFQRDTGVFTAHLKSVPRSCPSRAVLLSDPVFGSSPGNTGDERVVQVLAMPFILHRNLPDRAPAALAAQKGHSNYLECHFC